MGCAWWRRSYNTRSTTVGIAMCCLSCTQKLRLANWAIRAIQHEFPSPATIVLAAELSAGIQSSPLPRSFHFSLSHFSTNIQNDVFSELATESDLASNLMNFISSA